MGEITFVQNYNKNNNKRIRNWQSFVIITMSIK